jgi:glycosyltransferase involved in cell wall biosynthesis
MSKNTKYAVVTPVRNEALFIPLTIRSMATQTVRAADWVVVNDGSADLTGEIAEAAAREHNWIQVVNRADRGYRKAGGGVVDAFYDGYRLIENAQWEYVVKLDGDLSFEPAYFERCFDCFDRNPRLGIAGGTICSPNGSAEPESKGDPKFHVRGATKIYRRACWEAIGGLLRAPGWDTLDEVKANMLGWQTCTLANIKILHHRPTGAAYGAWKDRVKSGLANYITGYHPLFMLIKCARRMVQKPLLVGGLGLMFGFLKGYVKRTPQVEDRALIQYFRQQQMNRLLGRKSLWS